jgi:hypothetical protein
MTKQETLQALKEIHPSLCKRRDFEFTPEGALVWKPATLAHGFSQPTESALEEALAVAKERQRLAAFAPITASQMRLQMIKDGKNPDQVTTIINALPAPSKAAARVLWEYSTEIHRDHPLTLQLATAMGYDTTSKQDTFFIAAVKLKQL